MQPSAGNWGERVSVAFVFHLFIPSLKITQNNKQTNKKNTTHPKRWKKLGTRNILRDGLAQGGMGGEAWGWSAASFFQARLPMRRTPTRTPTPQCRALTPTSLWIFCARGVSIRCKTRRILLSAAPGLVWRRRPAWDVKSLNAGKTGTQRPCGRRMGVPAPGPAHRGSPPPPAGRRHPKYSRVHVARAATQLPGRPQRLTPRTISAPS